MPSNYFEDVDYVPTLPLDEAHERGILGGRNRPGALALVVKGRPGDPLRVTIHGVNDSPAGVRALTERSFERKVRVETFVYDDQFRRLTDSANDLLAAMSPWLVANPGTPVSIDAHSMGTRICLAAAASMEKASLFGGRVVELNLAAPILQGLAVANAARSAPELLEWVAGIAPAQDMGTTCDFQKRIDAIRFPANVKVRLFVGGKDTIVDSQDEAFLAIEKNLAAERVDFSGATHTGVIAEAASWLLARDPAPRL
jgi:hypothetical protein